MLRELSGSTRQEIVLGTLHEMAEVQGFFPCFLNYFLKKGMLLSQLSHPEGQITAKKKSSQVNDFYQVKGLGASHHHTHCPPTHFLKSFWKHH